MLFGLYDSLTRYQNMLDPVLHVSQDMEVITDIIDIPL